MRTMVLTTLAASALLAGCGLRGDLERPAPMGAATPAPRAGEGQADGQDSRADQPQADPVAPVTRPENEGGVPPVSQAPLEGTNDPIGRPPTVTAAGPR